MVGSRQGFPKVERNPPAQTKVDCTTSARCPSIKRGWHCLRRLDTCTAQYVAPSMGTAMASAGCVAARAAFSHIQHPIPMYARSWRGCQGWCTHPTLTWLTVGSHTYLQRTLVIKAHCRWNSLHWIASKFANSRLSFARSASIVCWNNKSHNRQGLFERSIEAACSSNRYHEKSIQDNLWAWQKENVMRSV